MPRILPQFVVLDTETTGLDPSSDRLIDLGAVRLGRDLQIVDRFQTLVDPGVPIPLYITRMVGICDDDVRGAPSFAEAYAAFRAFAGDAVLAGHNVSFDRDHLAAGARRCGLAAALESVVRHPRSRTAPVSRARPPRAAAARGRARDRARGSPRPARCRDHGGSARAARRQGGGSRRRGAPLAAGGVVAPTRRARCLRRPARRGAAAARRRRTSRRRHRRGAHHAARQRERLASGAGRRR